MTSMTDNDDANVDVFCDDKKIASLWKRYVLALLLIAGVITSFFVVSEFIASKSYANATVINLAGRQRMLSQRIALFANKYLTNYETVEEETDTLLQLFESRNSFAYAHDILVSGQQDKQATAYVRDVAGDIYFSAPYDLDHNAKKYINLVDDLFAAQTVELKKQALASINRMSQNHMLVSLDVVVNRLEKRDTYEMQMLHNIERIFFVVAILLLLIEGVIIIWPAHRYIMSALEQRSLISDALNDKRAAELASAAKSDFLANMSHELRTPLNSILGVSQLVQKREIEAELKDFLNIIDVSARNLLKIVNDILDLSKIESGDTQLEYVAFNAGQNILETIDTLRPLASKKGLLLNLDSQIGDDLYVLGDPLRFSRILLNLVNNAINYTELGSITVKVSIADSERDQKTIKTSITDTGIGIAEHRLEHIFDKFTQADASTTRKYGGTGLGLTITKQLVTLMGGQIGVQSIEHSGSRFWFHIPFEFMSKEAFEKKNAKIVETISDAYNNAHNRKKAENIHVLMAEDQQMNIIFMKRIFSELNIENYTIVETGSAALRKVEKNDYDLIIMDCHMSEMNGYEATEAIRALDDPAKSKIPIIAMTANVMQKDIDYCYEVGMDEYIGKPFDLTDLINTLSNWIDFETELQTKTADTQNDDVMEFEGIQCRVDLSQLSESVAGDTDFIREMIETFVTQADEQILDLEDLCVDGVSEDWVEVSHALKGTAAGVGVLSMNMVAGTAQEMYNASADDRKKILEDLKDQYNAALLYFKKEGWL